MPVFEVVVIEEPSQNKKNEGELETLIFGPVIVIAANSDSAKSIALVENAHLLKDMPIARMKVLVRPFC